MEFSFTYLKKKTRDDFIFLFPGFMFILILLSGDVKGQEQDGDRFSPWTIEHAREMIDRNKGNDCFVILDTRTPIEYEKDHLKGARFLDFSAEDFWDRLLEQDTTRIYLVYCHDGGRSARAVKFMKEKGFREAHNLQGGILDWKRKGYPVERHEQ